MFGLLGNIGFVGRQVQQVTATTVFIDIMIFESQLRIHACFQVRTETERAGIQFAQFGISVTVMVVSSAITVLSEHINTGFMVVRHQRSIYRCVIIGTVAANHRQ